MVRVAGFEPTASWSRTMRATNCATSKLPSLGNKQEPGSLDRQWFLRFYYTMNQLELQEKSRGKWNGIYEVVRFLCAIQNMEIVGFWWAWFWSTISTWVESQQISEIPGILSLALSDSKKIFIHCSTRHVHHRFIDSFLYVMGGYLQNFIFKMSFRMYAANQKETRENSMIIQNYLEKTATSSEVGIVFWYS